jgi:predicted rRNA methylase
MPRKQKAQHEIIAGAHSVTEALRAGKRRIYEVYSSRSLPQGLEAVLAEKNIPVLLKKTDELSRIAGTEHHQQIAARVSAFPVFGLSRLFENRNSDHFPLYLVIDSVEDPRNLGALIRTAVCAGISAVITPKDRCAPPTPTVSRASAGALEHCTLMRVTNLVNALNELKENQIWVAGLDAGGSRSIYETDMTTAHAIVVGGEHTGIRRLAEKITKDDKGELVVPDHVIIPFIEGDGIGPDIWKATQAVIDGAVNAAYNGERKISWHELFVGEKGFKKDGQWLSQEALDEIKDHRVAIKGPLTTPVGEGIRSLNVSIRQKLDLFACIRPVKYIEPVPSPMKHPEKINMVIFRENTEDVYAGIEWASGTPKPNRSAPFLRRPWARTCPPKQGSASNRSARKHQAPGCQGH